MAINVSLAENHQQKSSNKKIIPRTKIKVFGIGGAGSNAVDSMIRASMEGVDFVACNTDQQTLENSLAETKIQLGAQTTQGLGTGSNPKTGAQAAHEALDEIKGNYKQHAIIVSYRWYGRWHWHGRDFGNCQNCPRYGRANGGCGYQTVWI